jgi:hypothetical protein
MQLPDDVLTIIRDYSKPLTRPDWKTVCPLSGNVFYTNVIHELRANQRKAWISKHVLVDNILFLYSRVFNHLTQSDWGRIYMLVRILGIKYTSSHYRIPIQEVYELPGMLHAENCYIQHY